MKTILFVCTGNICRSPMAEAFFNYYTGKTDLFRAISAGIGTIDGQPASPNAIQAMQQVGIDISNHRSRQITAELVTQADFIIGMTQGHIDAINMLYPQSAEKTFVLCEFIDNLKPFERDIADPIGGNLETYIRCRDQIKEGVLHFIRYLEDNFVEQPIMNKNSDIMSIIIASDHRGLQLKQAIKDFLINQGFDVVDKGPFTESSTDYPDYAFAVAKEIKNNENSFGILICSTGIGMSIAANKFEGIRAALAMNEEMASLARKHNNANILCLGASLITKEQAINIVNAFLHSEFEAGRHERRVNKINSLARTDQNSLKSVDPEVFNAIFLETQRQQENIELIASENFTSLAVMEAQGSVLTNKYAEGYPSKRWYGGCENIDVIEQLAIERAKKLFGAEHANVQPHSGSAANMIVYFAFLKPGDKILTMDLTHGGHLTHGNRVNFSGRFFEVVHYGVRKEDEQIDYDELAKLAEQHRPKMITVGASAYPRIINFERMGKIAKEVGAYLLADIAHIAGLVAAGLHPSPIGHADFITTTTHKTLRGPRGGLILCSAKYAKEIDAQTFPGVQGGPLEHVIAAKAVCFHEALQPSFKDYQQQIIKNAKTLAECLKRNGFRLVSGGTDNHLMLVDVGQKGLTGKECQIALDSAGITVNKNTIPFETRSPFQASGIRIGTPAVTTRGMKEQEMAAIADMISEVLLDIKNVDTINKVRERVRDLTARFPLPY